MKLVYAIKNIILIFTAEGVTVNRTQVIGSMGGKDNGKITKEVQVPEHVLGRLTLNVSDHLGFDRTTSHGRNPLDVAATVLKDNGVLTDTFYLVDEVTANLIENFLEYSSDTSTFEGECNAVAALVTTLEGMADGDFVVKTVVPKYSELIQVKLDPDCCCGYDIAQALKLTNFRIEYIQDDLAYLHFDSSMIIPPEDDDMHMKVMQELENMLKGTIDIDFIGDGYNTTVDKMLIIGEYGAIDLAKVGLRMFANNKSPKFIKNIGATRYIPLIAPTGKAADVLEGSYKTKHSKMFPPKVDMTNPNRNTGSTNSKSLTTGTDTRAIKESISESDLPLPKEFYIDFTHVDNPIRISNFSFGWSGTEEICVQFDTSPRVQADSEAAYAVLGEIMHAFENIFLVGDVMNPKGSELASIELGTIFTYQDLVKLGFPVHKSRPPHTEHVSAADAPYNGQMEPNVFEESLSLDHSVTYDFNITNFQLVYTKSDSIHLIFDVQGFLEVDGESQLARDIHAQLCAVFAEVFTLGSIISKGQLCEIKLATKLTFDEAVGTGLRIEDDRVKEEGHFIAEYRVVCGESVLTNFNICWYDDDHMYLQFSTEGRVINLNTDEASDMFSELESAFDGYLELGACTSETSFEQISITTMLTLKEAKEIGFPVSDES